MKIRSFLICAVFFSSVFCLKAENRGNDTLLHQGVETALIESVRLYALNDFFHQKEFLDSCSLIYPNSSAIKYELGKLYFAIGDMKNSLKYAKFADSVARDNRWYKDLLFKIYVKTEDYNEAAEICKELIRLDPNDDQKYLYLSEIYDMSGQKLKAIEILYDYQERFGKNRFITDINYSLLYEYVLSMKPSDKNSMSVIDKCRLLYNENEGDIRYTELLSMACINGGMPSEAHKILKKIKKDSLDQLVYLNISNRMLDAQNYALYEKYSRRAFSSKYIPYKNKLEFILNMSNRYSQIKDSVDSRYAGYVKSSILYLKNKFKDSTDIAMVYCDWLKNINDSSFIYELEKILPLSDQKYYIYHELIIEFFNLSKYDKVDYYCNLAIKEYPEEPMPYYQKAVLLFMQSKIDASLEYLDKGLKFVPKFSNLQVLYLALMGDCFYNQKKYDRAFSYYEESLKIYPENYLLLNNYAFYLSELDMDLEKAKVMSRKALNNDLLNPVYLDTYAWILYKLKDYISAEKYMKKAIEHMSTEEREWIYYGHYGDILNAVGKKEAAVQNWRKAMEMDGADKEELLKKIKNNGK